MGPYKPTEFLTMHSGATIGKNAPCGGAMGVQGERNSPNEELRKKPQDLAGHKSKITKNEGEERRSGAKVLWREEDRCKKTKG